MVAESQTTGVVVRAYIDNRRSVTSGSEHRSDPSVEQPSSSGSMTRSQEAYRIRVCEKTLLYGRFSCPKQKPQRTKSGRDSLTVIGNFSLGIFNKVFINIKKQLIPPFQRVSDSKHIDDKRNHMQEGLKRYTYMILLQQKKIGYHLIRRKIKTQVSSLKSLRYLL